MPKSKTAPRRAKKLEKARNRQMRQRQSADYTLLLDTLRESLNNRFFEEQGFPHLEYLAQHFKGDVGHGNLSDYVELLNCFCGFGWTIAEAIRAEAPYSMQEREDRVAAVAYTLAATLMNIRPDFVDDSGWMGSSTLFNAVRERWGRSKMIQAGINLQNRFMDSRDLCCLFAMDFVMTFIDITGELAQMGGNKVVSVTDCKNQVITCFAGFTTRNLALAGTQLPDLEKIFAENAVTEEFRKEYPDWKAESADALDVRHLGFNALSEEDMNFTIEMLSNQQFLHDMQVLYTAQGSADIPQGKREEIVMGYVLRDGPRCRKAFAEDRDPTEEEMDRDAEVVNGIIMQMVTAGGVGAEIATGTESATYRVETQEAAKTVYAPNFSQADSATIAAMIQDAKVAVQKREAGEKTMTFAQAAVAEALAKMPAEPKKQEDKK